MTVRELKKRLEQFDDNIIVLIPNTGWHPYSIDPPETPATSVSRVDGCVVIDNYEEDDDE